MCPCCLELKVTFYPLHAFLGLLDLLDYLQGPSVAAASAEAMVFPPVPATGDPLEYECHVGVPIRNWVSSTDVMSHHLPRKNNSHLTHPEANLHCTCKGRGMIIIIISIWK